MNGTIDVNLHPTGFAPFLSLDVYPAYNVCRLP
jgi:hypothetical protein